MATDVELVRRRFTLDEYHRMGQAGILHGDEPGPSDVALLVEVADTSLRYDRRVKGPLYAEAGVQDYWIFDLAGDALEVHREPGPGGFRHVERVGRAAVVAPLAFPDIRFSVLELLG